MPALSDMTILTDAPIPTWFGIGGRADRLVHVDSIENLKRCIEIDPALRILGDGANLLVDDDGVPELVAALDASQMTTVGQDRAAGFFFAMAGADLPRTILETIRLGLGGLESLGGIPATVGGAVIMNAGGAFGQIADHVARVHALDRSGREVILDRGGIDFSYRQSGLQHLIITRVDFALVPADPAALRDRLKQVMAYKKTTQPLAASSAGCVFKNPLACDLSGVSPPDGKAALVAGSRVSAGFLIDRAGCKGLASGGATVSDRHANFITTSKDARARDVITLMGLVRERVLDRFGVALEPEVVVWKRV
jgi:UDP-N-acetylmuramate dehydrogenase